MVLYHGLFFLLVVFFGVLAAGFSMIALQLDNLDPETVERHDLNDFMGARGQAIIGAIVSSISAAGAIGNAVFPSEIYSKWMLGGLLIFAVYASTLLSRIQNQVQKIYTDPADNSDQEVFSELTNTLTMTSLVSNAVLVASLWVMVALLQPVDDRQW